MRDVYFTLALLVWSGYRINAISALSSVYLVQPGDDVVLPCNVTFNLHTLWFRQQSEDMIHLTTTTRDNLNNSTIDEFHAVDLHYASLHLTNKPHPPQKKETTPPPGDIVYAAVSLKPPADKN
ncbi:hypothetical protein JZ751_010665 [Albula glossodonta]|uniref:Uncharacterized protein n=1 Tax=Albula glossodonta TaxID=121402 RepID=A0A8T2MZT0_9TELE|nr:hypothetical protein JZ751_010665 [Albula glossodonta]